MKNAITMQLPRRKQVTAVPGLDHAALLAFLETQEDVAAVYLFGSLAQGRATFGSDIDPAINQQSDTNRQSTPPRARVCSHRS
jgi:predicted nucleotidyltransferase